jgi:four helix bundle protein
LEIALKEARETQYWLEIIIESGLVEKEKFGSLLTEVNEIGKILVTSTKKLKER